MPIAPGSLPPCPGSIAITTSRPGRVGCRRHERLQFGVSSVTCRGGARCGTGATGAGPCPPGLGSAPGRYYGQVPRGCDGAGLASGSSSTSGEGFGAGAAAGLFATVVAGAEPAVYRSTTRRGPTRCRPAAEKTVGLRRVINFQNHAQRGITLFAETQLAHDRAGEIDVVRSAGQARIVDVQHHAVGVFRLNRR